jgi:hypothetical protein
MPFWVHDYYSPSSNEGIIKKQTCYETSGPPDTIEFKRSDVIFKISVSEIEAGIHVFVRLHIPKGRSVRLESPVVKISTVSNSFGVDGIFSPNLYTSQTQWKIDEEMVGDTKISNIGLFGPRTYDNYYSIGATVAMKKSNNITVHMPNIYINNVMVRLPDINFKKDKYLEFFMPINC